MHTRQVIKCLLLQFQVLVFQKHDDTDGAQNHNSNVANPAFLPTTKFRLSDEMTSLI